jgi:hypothetical protein
VLAIHFFSLFALLLVYPIAVVRALASFRFFPALVLHLQAVLCFGLFYMWKTRKLPKAERVGPFAFAPLTFLMPVTYALLTPLAMFTLDSGSWETRNHAPVEDDVPETIRDLVSAPIAAAANEQVSRAQMPAA